jgi:hypothetical protein
MEDINEDEPQEYIIGLQELEEKGYSVGAGFP